jgi:hypothetical protein
MSKQFKIIAVTVILKVGGMLAAVYSAPKSAFQYTILCSAAFP